MHYKLRGYKKKETSFDEKLIFVYFNYYLWLLIHTLLVLTQI